MLSFLGRKSIYEAEIQNEEEDDDMEIGKNETLNTNSGVLSPNEMRAFVGGQVLVASAKKIQKETVEELMDKVTDREFITTNHIDGQPLSVVRTEDIMQILCEYFEVDGKSTAYSAYCTVK